MSFLSSLKSWLGFLAFLFFTTSSFANVGNCQGTVTDSITLLPISGVQVQLLHGGAAVAVTTTNGAGFYQFLNQEPKGYTLTFSKTGYATFSVGVNIKKNQTSVVDIALTPSVSVGTISGTLQINGVNPPVPASSILALYQNNILLATTQADGLGAYQFIDLTPGNYSVKATYPGCTDQTQSVDVTAGNTTVLNFNLITAPSGTIQGNVKDIDGNNLASSEIDVIQNSVLIATVFTDINGNYTVTGLPFDLYVVHCTNPNFQAQIQAVNVPNATPVTVNFVLNPNPGALTGYVRDNNGAPLAGALVEVNYNNLVVFQTLTDINGLYLFQGLPPRTYVINAHDAGYQTGIANATIVANQTTTLNFTLIPGAALLSGNVKEVGTLTPIANALVELNVNNIALYTTLTDTLGNYSFLGVTPGNYVVHVHKSGYQTDITGVTLAEGSNTLDFLLNPGAGTGQIQGTVTDAITTSPITYGVFVKLFIGFVDSFYFLDAVVADINGFYSFSGLDPCYKYKVVVDKFGYTSQTSNPLSVVTSPVTQNFALQPYVSGPENLQGEVLVNKSGLQADRIHRLTWQPSLDVNTGSYRVYRNNALLANISTAGPFVFDDHHRQFNVIDTYKVFSVSSVGNEGFSEQVSLR